MRRHFRDGSEQNWWALEAEAGPFGPDKPQRLIVATTDPATLPEAETWYLVSNLPAPGTALPGEELKVAMIAEVVRLYGLRVWIEQTYKQVKNTLGWAEYPMRSESGYAPPLGAGVLCLELLLVDTGPNPLQ